MVEWIPEYDLEGPLPSRSVPCGRAYTNVVFDPNTALIIAGSSLQARFASFDEAQKGIDDVKAQIADLKKSMDDPESKALSDRYTEITTELDKIKAEQDDVFKNINALRDERTQAHEDQQKKYATVKEIKDRYYQARRAAADYEKDS